MIVIDPNILAVARSLVRRYGDEAKRHALVRISELSDEGDLMGQNLWIELVPENRTGG